MLGKNHLDDLDLKHLETLNLVAVFLEKMLGNVYYIYIHNWIFHFALLFTFFSSGCQKKNNESDLGSEDP